MAPEGVGRDFPHLTNNGQGVTHANAREPGVTRFLSDDPDNTFHPHTMPLITRWMQLLSARLRHVRVINGDWRRVCTTGAAWTLPVRQGKGPAGVFLDPPYSKEERAGEIYAHDITGLAAEVRQWCLANGDKEKFRIVLAGYAGEGHEPLEEAGWIAYPWYTKGFLTGGYGNIDGTSQQSRERLWASPHCLKPGDDAEEKDNTLFDTKGD